MLTHYAELVPKGCGLLYELYGRLLKGVHLINGRGCNLAVDWPHWKDDCGQFGLVMRVLGPKANIESYLAVVAPLLDHGLVTCVEGVQSVPDNAVLAHHYKRDRRIDKFSPARQRRLVRRATGRGETYQSKRGEAPTATHALPMQSQSNAQLFHMFITRAPINSETDCLAPNTYGLGIPVPSF